MSHGQQPLFPDETPPRTGVVAALAREQPAGKSQVAFRRLVEKIEARRETLQRWHTYLTRYQQRLIRELEPLRLELRDGQRKMVLLIDELLTRPRKGVTLPKTIRAKLRQMLVNLTAGLLHEEPDAELVTLHDKYADITHEESRELDRAMTQSMLESALGIDMGEQDAPRDAEDLWRHAHAKALEREAQRDRQRAARQAKRQGGKAAKMQAKREQAAKEVTQSVREVYRKLASALHPDREPDPAERERKGALMQRVNTAYDTGDLLTLLNIQLEIEQIDAEHLSSLSEARLKHYTQVMREQLAKLDEEIAALTAPFAWIPGKLTPEQVDRSLSAELIEIRAAIDDLNRHLTGFSDPRQLRQLLKDYPLEEDDLDDLADALMDEILSQIPPRGRKRRR